MQAMPRRTLLLSALVLVAATATPAAAAEPAAKAVKKPATSGQVAEEEDFQTPPPGSAEDQALWRAGNEAGLGVRSSRAEASRLQRSTRTSRLLERLDQAARGLAGEEAAALRALRQRLSDQWKENYGIMARRWPVEPTRGCGYPVLMFDSALRAAAAKAPRADVATARSDLKTCVERAEVAVKGMTASNETFRATLDEAVKRLAEVEPPAPAREAATGAPAAVPGAAATPAAAK